MALSLGDGSPENALEVIKELLSKTDAHEFKFDPKDFESWAKIHVYLPQHNLDSEITPQYMEAFLELQRQIYQFAAFVSTGVSDARQLTEGDRQALQINIHVSGGSSDYVADLLDIAEGLLERMVGKMTGRQATIVMVAIASLVAGSVSYGSWLEVKKDLGIEEFKSQDHQKALSALSFANQRQAESFSKLQAILEEQGETGKKALEAVIATNEALLKAAANTPESQINEQTLKREEAQLLRKSPRRQPEQRIVKQQIRVIDINTSDPIDLQIVIKHSTTGEEYRLRFKDSLFAHDDRTKLFQALESRDLIWVELAQKEIEGEVRSVEILRCIDPPKEATDNEQ